jgi:hypothetical protein
MLASAGALRGMTAITSATTARTAGNVQKIL